MTTGRSINYSPALAAALASACLLAVTACGNGNGGGTAPATTATAPTPTTPARTTSPQPAARTVKVSETDFALRLPESAHSSRRHGQDSISPADRRARIPGSFRMSGSVGR